VPNVGGETRTSLGRSQAFSKPELRRDQCSDIVAVCGLWRLRLRILLFFADKGGIFGHSCRCGLPPGFCSPGARLRLHRPVLRKICAALVHDGGTIPVCAGHADADLAWPGYTLLAQCLARRAAVWHWS